MFRYIFIIPVTFLLICSCERIGNNVSVSKLTFSCDTVYFDTVFSSIGSVTKELRIKNSGSTSLVIDHIYLAGGKSSQFRLNIDGEPLDEKYNVRLDAGDSIFIFIDANINPSDNKSPIEVYDSILFFVKDKFRKVNLVAWGQDIILLKNKIIEDESWGKGKPFVIYDKVTVDTSATLNLSEGARVYFHKNASMTIAGSLIVHGSVNSPVLFASDRLEKMYEDIPGQWVGILFLNSSRGNNMSNAIIRNTVYGLQLGEAGSGSEFPDLKLFSTVISHSTISGLSAINGKIEAANCVIYHCGNYCLYLTGGGDYTFSYCTMFARWEYGFRLTPAILISEKPEKPYFSTFQMDFILNNSVIYGDNASEIVIEPSSSGFTGNYYFDHCLIKLDTLHSSFWEKDEFPGTMVNQNPLFIDPEKWDFRPDTLSPLIRKGNPAYSSVYPLDIRGASRTLNGNPDIGAYERLTGEQ